MERVAIVFIPLSEMAELSFTARVEQPPSFLMILPSSLAFPLGRDAQVGRSAAVERGPSQGARSGSTGPMWVSFPLHSSEAARCASTKDTQPSRSHSWFLQYLSRIRRVRQLGVWVQCPDAVVAPMPVSDLTS